MFLLADRKRRADSGDVAPKSVAAPRNSTVLPSGGLGSSTETIPILQSNTNAMVRHLQSRKETTSSAAYASKSYLNSGASSGAVLLSNRIDLSPKYLFHRSRPFT